MISNRTQNTRIVLSRLTVKSCKTHTSRCCQSCVVAIHPSGAFLTLRLIHKSCLRAEGPNGASHRPPCPFRTISTCCAKGPCHSIRRRINTGPSRTIISFLTRTCRCCLTSRLTIHPSITWLTITCSLQMLSRAICASRTCKGCSPHGPIHAIIPNRTSSWHGVIAGATFIIKITIVSSWTLFAFKLSSLILIHS